MIQLKLLPVLATATLMPLELFTSPNMDKIHSDPIVPTVQAQNMPQPLQAPSLGLYATISPMNIAVDYQVAFSPSSVIAAVNAVREAHGLADLTESAALDRTAGAKAYDLCHGNYWAHVNPNTGKSGVSYMPAAGQYGNLGENLEEGARSVDETITAWMGSATHFATMTSSLYSETGVSAIVCTDYIGRGSQIIVVEHFRGDV